MLLKLLGNQVLCRDMHLLVLSIAADLNHFHTVQKGPWDWLQGIRRGNEQYLRQIHRDLQIVVAELPVLLTVQHFQKRREGIPLVIVADLVNLVQKHQRVLHLRLPQTVGNPARHRAYIGLPVSPDFRLVPYSP